MMDKALLYQNRLLVTLYAPCYLVFAFSNQLLGLDNLISFGASFIFTFCCYLLSIKLGTLRFLKTFTGRFIHLLIGLCFSGSIFFTKILGYGLSGLFSIGLILLILLTAQYGQIVKNLNYIKFTKNEI